MIGNIIGFGVVLFLCSFVIGTGVLIVKELIARKRASGVHKENIDGKEDESRTDL